MEQSPGKFLLGPSMTPTMNIAKRVGTGAWNFQSGSGANQATRDFSFSSSLPVLPHEKLMVNGDPSHESLDDAAASLNQIHQGVDDSLDDIAKQTLAFLLPDNEDELFAGIADYDLSTMPSQLEESEDADLFDSMGGMELENDAEGSLSMGMTKFNLTDNGAGNGILQYGPSNGAGTIVGEHPYGEHPSRTLFVRNINSNVEDLELRTLFEQYGDIRTMYTACKHRGFVMISYYDIRDARAAMRGLQNKPLRRRKLDIHFSIPKDNPSEKDINQGTLVVFNLDPIVSNEELRQIFGAYGEVKEIRETPQKRHHKFIEFYDVRAADQALKALNMSDIAGKRIKLEPSRPGGTRRNLMLQLNQELELDESRTFRHHIGSPITNSPPGNWATQFSNSPIEHSSMHTSSRSPGYGALSPTTLSPTSFNLNGLASVLKSQVSNSLKPIGKEPARSSQVEHLFGDSNTELRSSNFHHPHSFPEHLKVGQYSSDMSSTSYGSDIETLSGPQFLWGSPSTNPEKVKTAWPNSSSGGGHPLTSNGHGNGFLYPIRQQSSLVNSYQHHHHHVGSAPTGFFPDRRFGFFPESPDASVLHAGGAFGGGVNIGPRSRNVSYMMNMGSRAPVHGGIAGNMSDHGSPSFRMMSSPRFSPFLSNGSYPGFALNGGEIERGRSQRFDNTAYQTESRMQFQLDLEKIAKGEDSRTTLMIKNIPNKYTSKMLLLAIDETHKGTYDFIYLPIDFKNKCNVGYAFINMLSPSHIVSFYEAFNGKKWEKFNSEKVASLAYARIQGKAALVAHFQNSSLMNEDKRCRPILFHSDGTEAGEPITQEHLNNQLTPQNAFEAEDSPVGTTRVTEEEKLGQL